MYCGEIIVKLEWMGRYRELIRMIIKYNNLFFRLNSEKFINNSKVKLSIQQWQTMECIIEYENTNSNMVFFARQLGIPKSSLSKNVAFLVANGFVEKYRQSDNGKNIVLKSTETGRSVYHQFSSLIYNEAWKEAFEVLDTISDENLDAFTLFMEKLAADLEPENNKIIKLMKLP